MGRRGSVARQLSGAVWQLSRAVARSVARTPAVSDKQQALKTLCGAFQSLSLHGQHVMFWLTLSFLSQGFYFKAL